MTERTDVVRAPSFPLYSDVASLLPIFNGVPKSHVTSLIRAISEQTGTPQNPVDWSHPDTWITQRLSGEDAALAHRIWQQSQHMVNPRHIYGSYLFMNNEALLVQDARHIFQIGPRGEDFLRGDTTLIHELDEHEGLPQLLQILATKPRAKRGDLLPEWAAFLALHSHFQKVAKDTLRRRLLNLCARGLVARDGLTYTITPAGLSYIEGLSPFAAVSTSRQPDSALHVVSQSVRFFNQEQRAALREQLGKMHPYQFEHLVRDLLEAMGYDNVEVTRESGDKGVDVVATIEFGITTITEVVQVKRYHGNIQRPVLDQLRGALPYHKAIRGTIITLGDFSRGCVEVALFPGAAPIGLIDGEKLLDLLIEHEIGVTKRQVLLHEVDFAYFATPQEDELLPGSEVGTTVTVD